MDAVTDTVANEIYSPDNCSLCVYVCVSACVSVPSRGDSLLLVQSDGQHVREGCAGTERQTAEILQATTDSGTHTPHTDVLYIQFIHNLPALKELTHSDLRWFAVCNQTRIIHDKHTRQNTWPPRCAPFLKSERLSWDIQTCCGRLNHALHFLAKGYVLTGHLEFSKTVSWSSVGGITEDFSFGRANSAKPASAEIILTWNDIFHHSSYSGCCGVNMLRVYRHSDTFNYQ